MPDISDVGPPAKGPGLPERIAEAKPPPVKVRIEHGWVWPCYVCIKLNLTTYTTDETAKNRRP